MRENNIYGHVIQNAKDIQTLGTRILEQDRINKKLSTAGVLTSASMMLLGVCVWYVASFVDKLEKRVKHLEEE